MLLPASQVAVGHCVIANDTECPESKMVCVVTAVDGDNVRLQYLNADKMFDSYNKRRGWLSRATHATPLATFGVSIAIEPNGNLYTCRKVGESQAVYLDGKHRPWQEREPHLYRFRRDVAEVCRQTAAEFTDADERWLRAVIGSAASGSLVLVQTFSKHTGDPVKLLCQMVTTPLGVVMQIPLAEMPDRDMSLLYEDPSVSGRVLTPQN